MSSIKIIITSILLLIFGSISLYLGGIPALGSFIISIGSYTLIVYFLVAVWKKLRKKHLPDSRIFIQNFLSSLSILLATIAIASGLFSYLANEKYPIALKQYTLSNGEKTVIFQSMMHIAREDFYTDVKEELKKAKESGAVYFYEGVLPGTKENHDAFNIALGVNFDKDFYKYFSKLYGLVAQDQNTFLGIVNDLDFNIDSNMDEIMTAYKKLTKHKKIETKESINASKQIQTALAQLTPRQLSVLQYVNKAILNTMLSNEQILEQLQVGQNHELFKVILDKRDKHLAEEIIKTKHKKIFVTYGGLHFKGVLQLLQKNDNKWKIIKEKSFYPITIIK